LDSNPERAVELANEAISTFALRFEEHWLAGMRNKLGLARNEDGDLELTQALLRAMHENDADFTLNLPSAVRRRRRASASLSVLT
jgi:serine/tyrosine/threonine adenylyltransferase